MEQHHKVAIIAVGVAAIVIGVLIFAYTTKTASQTLSPVTVPFQKLAEGMQSGVVVRSNFVITSEDQLQELLKLINVSNVPAIDWKTQAVLAVFGDDDTSTITVKSIEDATSRLVFITVARPDASCSRKETAAPYELVIVPQTSLSFTHTDSVLAASCQK